MHKKDPDLIRDYESYVIYWNYFEELKRPPVNGHRFGTLETFNKSGGGNKLVIDYKLTFISSGMVSLELSWCNPWTRVRYLQEIIANIGYKTMNKYWFFECGIQTHKDCWNNNNSLWLGKLKNKWGCQSCGRIRRYALDIEDKIRPFRKNPHLILQVLGNPLATEQKKKWAIVALEKLTNKFKKMTKNWEILQPHEKEYYKILRYVLFYPDKKKGRFKPSILNTSEPLPFQGIR